jgi:hypothetical protein
MARLLVWLPVLAAASGRHEPGPFRVHMPEEYADGMDQWDVVSQIVQQLKMKSTGRGISVSKLPQVTHLRLNMSDGVQLATTIINPYPYNATKAAAVVRSPYGPTSEQIADLFVASNGFAAVLQDDRGTFTSGGNFDMFRTARADGRSTMDWVVKQPWSNGDVFTMGVSADGINEASQVIGAPPMLKGQWWMWTTGNGHHFSYPGGAYRYDLVDGYMNAMDIEIHNAGARMKKEIRAHEPFSDYWSNITICRNESQLTEPDCRWGNVKWPIVLSSGWWDIFQETAIDAWNAMRLGSDPSVRDKHVHIVAPLGHCILSLTDLHPVYTAAEFDAFVVAQKVAAETFRGNFDGPTRSKIGRLNLYIMGGFGQPATKQWNYWTSLQDWPPFTPKVYYLQSPSTLENSTGVESSIEYEYNPKNPAPMIGGNNLPIPVFSQVPHCGYADLASRERRRDVLTFDSEPLSDDMAIVGSIEAKLFVSSSANDTDFFVTLSDLYKGRSTLVRYGIQRMRWRDNDRVQSPSLVPGEVYEVNVRLASTAYVFPKGHRVRVSVSSAAHPYYNPNYNTGTFSLTNKTVKPVVAHNTIHMGSSHPSQIRLPLVSFKDIPENVAFPSLGDQHDSGHMVMI